MFKNIDIHYKDFQYGGYRYNVNNMRDKGSHAFGLRCIVVLSRLDVQYRLVNSAYVSNSYTR